MFIRVAYRATSVALLAAMVLAVPCHAQKKYGLGASDKEVKLGQTMPYSGPLSLFGTIGRRSHPICLACAICQEITVELD